MVAAVDNDDDWQAASHYADGGVDHGVVFGLVEIG
jgi:hypothetical protein